LILNDDVVKQVERDVLHMGVQMAGQYAKQQMMSGAPPPVEGAGMLKGGAMPTQQQLNNSPYFHDLMKQFQDAVRTAQPPLTDD
jgi:hypothetical protein